LNYFFVVHIDPYRNDILILHCTSPIVHAQNNYFCKDSLLRRPTNTYSGG
jgi:hypothetical protein